MTVTDQVIADAKDLPSLVDGLKAVDPALAEQFTGKALLASKSPWGTLLAGAVTWLAGRYGLGWPPEVCALLGGAGVLAGAFVMRAVTKSPISGLFTKGTAP